MKIHQLTSLATVLVAAGIGGSAFAGTPGLTGLYTGTYNITVRHSDNSPRGVGTAPGTWVWDFNNKQAVFSNGSVAPPAGGPAATYAQENPYVLGGSTNLPLHDNGDGTYTVYYNFRVNNPAFPQEFVANTSSTFEITAVGTNAITVSTVDVDIDGVLVPQDGVVGTSIPNSTNSAFWQPGVFPFAAERDRQGTASK